MAGLYLDGIYDLVGKLEEYKVDVRTDSFSCKKDVWLRITLFVHVALTLTRTVIVQWIRGTGNIICGTIHLDGERIVMGLNDYLSFSIQTVVLPVLGILTFVAPQTGYRLLSNFRDSCDTARQASDIVFMHEENQEEAFHTSRQRLAETVMGIFGFFTALMHTLTSSIEYCLCLSVQDAWKILCSTGRLIVIAPKDGFSSFCRKNSSREIYSAHRIALESFNPSAVF